MPLHSLIPSIIKKSSFIIEKGKKYVKPGVKPPKGVVLHRGPKGGSYYFVEDKHLQSGGKHHELVRSKGVTADQFKAIEEHYKSQGAESVQFVHKPNVERNKEGKKLYNIYVRHQDTDQRLADKAAKDKARYGKKKESSPEEKLKAEMGNLHPKIFFTKQMKKLHPDADPAIIQQGSVAAHARYTLALKEGHPTPISEGVRVGHFRTTTLEKHPPPKTTVEDVRSEIMAEREKKKPEKKQDEFYQDWTPKTFSSSREAEDQIRYFQTHGYEVKDYTSEGQGNKQKHTFEVRKKPAEKPNTEPVIPADATAEASDKIPEKKPGLKKDSEFLDQKKAERQRAKLERDGFISEVRPKKIGKTTVYGVYRKKRSASGSPAPENNITAAAGDDKKPEKTNDISISHDPTKKRAWVARMHSYQPHNPPDLQYGRDFLSPSETSDNQHHYRNLSDGLYEARGSHDVNYTRFAIENGQKRDLSTKEYEDRLKLLPTMEQKLNVLVQVNQPKKMIRLDPGNTYNHRDWIKSLGGRYNSSTRTWSIPEPDDKILAQMKVRGIQTTSPGESGGSGGTLVLKQKEPEPHKKPVPSVQRMVRENDSEHQGWDKIVVRNRYRVNDQVSRLRDQGYEVHHRIVPGLKGQNRYDDHHIYFRKPNAELLALKKIMTDTEKPALKPGRTPPVEYRGVTISHHISDVGQYGPERYQVNRYVKEGHRNLLEDVLGFYPSLDQASSAIDHSVEEYKKERDSELKKRNIASMSKQYNPADDNNLFRDEWRDILG
jgi:hypothetical protein